MSLQLGANKVPASQAAAPPGQSTLTGEELLQTQNPCIYVCRVALVVSSYLQSCRLVCQTSLSGGFSRQEYWSVLDNTGCHPLLEHCISCCPSRKPPWGPGAARAPETQAAAPPLHLALTGAKPSPPGQPQEQTPVDDPHAEVEIKPQLKPSGSVAKREDPKPSYQLSKLQTKSTWSARQTLCLWNI